jgi:hypothetical protein
VDTLLANDGAMLLLESVPDEFLIVGTGLTVKVSRDPDTDARIAGISSIEEVVRDGSDWKVKARLNGDQSNQGATTLNEPFMMCRYTVSCCTLFHDSEMKGQAIWPARNSIFGGTGQDVL